MSEEEIKKLCKEEFLKNIKENIKSETIFTYVDGLEKENKKQKEILDKIKEYIKNLLKEEFEITDPDNINYGEKCQRAYFSDSELIKILELLEEIE